MSFNNGHKQWKCEVLKNLRNNYKKCIMIILADHEKIKFGREFNLADHANIKFFTKTKTNLLDGEK